MERYHWRHERIVNVRRESDGRYILTFPDRWGELWVESPDYEIHTGDQCSRWGEAHMTVMLVVGERVIYDHRKEFANWLAGNGWTSA